VDPWVCWSRANPLVQKVELQDASDGEWQCVRAADLELSTRTAYYLIKALGALARVPAP